MNWLRQLLGRKQLYSDLSEEIRAHISEMTEELVAGGMSREEAAIAARREFGNATLIEERGREVWRWRALENFFSDTRYAARQLWRTPSFTLAVIFTLALGIGANTAVFSVVNAVVLRPLPFPEPGQLAALESMDVRGAPHPANLSYPTFFDFRKQNQVFEHIVCYRDDEVTLTGAGEARQLEGQIVSWDLFPMLQVQPELGRGFLPAEEDVGARVAVISHRLWKEQFGGVPTVVGSTIKLDGQPHTVVGVAPAGFNFPVRNRQVQVWTTLARDAASATTVPITEQRGARMLDVTARLKAGVSFARARSQMDTVAAALAKQYPDHNKNAPATYVRPELERMVGEMREPMLILLGAVGLVLLIACANVANLLLARTAEREREFAVRLAIGAARGRVVRQLIAENLLFAVLGCTAGVLLAAGVIGMGLPLVAEGIPRILETVVDSRVIAFAVILALLTSLLCSIPPGLRMARLDFPSSPSSGTRTSTEARERLRGTLVVTQIALGLVLLSGAAMLAAAFLQLTRRDLGFRPDHLLAFNFTLPSSRYDDGARVRWYTQLLDRLNSLPGVVSASGGTPLPLTGDQMRIAFEIQGRPTEPSARPRSDMAYVTPAFFRTIGTPLLAGREFTERDDENGPPVVIVNTAFAREFFPGENAVGKFIRSGASSSHMGNPMREIVGVVANAKQSQRPGPDSIYYIPYSQLAWGTPSVIVRTSLPPLAMESVLRRAVASLDREVPVYAIHTFEEIASTAMAPPRFLTGLFGSFAGIGLLLMAVGLYGVLSYSVLRRTREIGIRIALGADRGMILSMVLCRSLNLVAVGIALGLAGVTAGDRLLRQLLFGTAPSRPLLMVLACAVIAVSALAAAYLPARRAAAIAPTEALRAE